MDHDWNRDVVNAAGFFRKKKISFKVIGWLIKGNWGGEIFVVMSHLSRDVTTFFTFYRSDYKNRSEITG